MRKVITFILMVTFILSLTGCVGTSTPGRGNLTDTEAKSLGEGETTSGNLQRLEDFEVSSANYPEMASYPDETPYIKSNGDIDDAYYDVYDAWWEDIRARRGLAVENADSLRPFFTDSIRQFLSGSQDKNNVYSPLNVYMALGMLSEVTDGESRNQILSLLGADSIEELRTQANTIWNANYRNDGATTSILASSLWLNEHVDFTESTLDFLSENYYASSYQGTMGSEEFDHALQVWLNMQTGGLLEEQVSGVSLDADTIMALAATINFHAKWRDEFLEKNTQTGTFHSADGDRNIDFMHQDYSRTYYWGEKFTAVSQSLESDGAMWFILPDEGISIDELLQDEQAMEFLVSNKYEWEDKKYLIVHLAVPKFDVVSDMDLIPGLKTLGITDVFDPTIADFSSMAEKTEDVYLSQAKHAVRVKIDEEGCTAVAYTVMAVSGAGAPPEEEVDFIVDRPFLFVITGACEMPLFVGVVNQP